MTVFPAAAARDEGHRQGPPPGSRPRHSTPHRACVDGRETPCNPHRYRWHSQGTEASTRHSSVTTAAAEKSRWSAETIDRHFASRRQPCRGELECFLPPKAEMEQRLHAPGGREAS